MAIELEFAYADTGKKWDLGPGGSNGLNTVFSVNQ